MTTTLSRAEACAELQAAGRYLLANELAWGNAGNVSARLGVSGGALQAICDLTMRVPYDETAAIQERQLPIYHLLCAVIEAEFFQPEA